MVFAESIQSSARHSLNILIIFILFVSGLTGLATGIMGLVLFVKWI
jgi:hypothetical protein